MVDKLAARVLLTTEYEHHVDRVSEQRHPMRCDRPTGRARPGCSSAVLVTNVRGLAKSEMNSQRPLPAKPSIRSWAIRCMRRSVRLVRVTGANADSRSSRYRV